MSARKAASAFPWSCQWMRLNHEWRPLYNRLLDAQNFSHNHQLQKPARQANHDAESLSAPFSTFYVSSWQWTLPWPCHRLREQTWHLPGYGPTSMSRIRPSWRTTALVIRWYVTNEVKQQNNNAWTRIHVIWGGGSASEQKMHDCRATCMRLTRSYESVEHIFRESSSMSAMHWFWYHELEQRPLHTYVHIYVWTYHKKTISYNPEEESRSLEFLERQSCFIAL